MPVFPLVLQAVLLVLAATAAVYDLRYRRIPNWLVLAGLLTGIGLNSFLFQWAGLRMAGLGIGLAFLIYFPLYLIRGMGAGDVKLMAAIGAVVGPGSWFLIFAFTALSGGALAIILVLFKGRVRKTLANLAYMLKELAYFRAPYAHNVELDVKSPQALKMPHGAAVAMGCVVFLLVVNFWAR